MSLRSTWLHRAIAFCSLSAAMLAGAQQTTMQQADQAFRAGTDAYARGDLSTARTQFGLATQLAPGIEEGHSALGVVLYALGQYPQAIAELETALKLNPDDRNAEENLAQAYSQTGSPDKAVVLFEKMDGESPLRADLLAVWARDLATGSNTTAAIEIMRRAVTAEPQNASLVDQLGSLYAQAGRWSDAEAAFSSALQMDAQLTSAHMHLAVVLSHEQQMGRAAGEFGQAAQLDPHNAAVQFEWGNALVAANDDDGAIPHFQQAIGIDPNLLDAEYQLALALQRSGRATEAIPLFQKVVEARPQQAEPLTNLGLALVQVGRAKEAVPLYLRASALTPENATIHQDLGAAYVQENNVDDAIREFQTGLKLAPQDPHLHYDLGLAFKLKDDLPDAIAELESALRLDPASPDAPYTLGILYMQDGRFDDAVRNLRAALELRPRNGDGWSILGSIYRQQGKYEDAAAALKKAIELLPEQPGPHITLASVLQEEGKQDDAVAERKKAADLTRVAVNRQRAVFATNAGNALLNKGQIADAIARYQDAIGSDPNYPEAHRQLSAALAEQGRSAEAAAERQKADALTAKNP
jgi:protein O-GlcNAc transferase